ncbi:MAG TPA: LysM peptidoglycan-binding domain-containing protein [Anaerolineae bacterium]|nr:LysM peptidoglycan-binding domain-containing protein [Anaerolineae bacterium]
MPGKEPDVADVIQSYRRRRERLMPMILGGLAVVLLIVGIILIVLWLTGANPPQLPFLSTRTLTPSITPTPGPPTMTPTPSNTPLPSETPTPLPPLVHVVQEGETLGMIAEAYEVDLLILMAFNGIDDANIIGVGTEILIPPEGTGMPTPTPLPSTLIPGQEIIYVVLPEDLLANIAARFNSTVEAIVAANDLDDPNNIFVGQRLIVPWGIITPVPTETATATETP